jgi:hypothetical protein
VDEVVPPTAIGDALRARIEAPGAGGSAGSERSPGAGGERGGSAGGERSGGAGSSAGGGGSGGAGGSDPAVAGGIGDDARRGGSVPATLLLIDDAETVDDVGELLARLSKSDRPDLLVVAAGRNDSVRSGYTHWTRQLRRSKLGVLLVPDVDYDGDILGTTIPRRPPVAMSAGRGYLVNSGRSELVQLALPE